MRRWAFFPLRDYPMSGVLKSPDGEVWPVACFTPAEAKLDARFGRPKRSLALHDDADLIAELERRSGDAIKASVR
jgi:hypothetical protein